ncbi:glycosyltransferase family 2 protein [Mucilaginibacter sp. RS28]|uniref:Glycosyltransferase family 2 protein n=1 Tax=Mucilaginibacter straminoryzae TaxID=2932774 RepID=A0A9X2B988_9SPHI|nr:glycosyltransferase family 2 protein [Mucilaginibacter straminoryzae]MCJ8210226.1 glycosyltransferase family 2 protein [Mucilaginibacter straminoryzae]
MLPVLDLTIAIPVKNEEVNLKGCLQAIGEDFAKKIVLIDSGSTDGTKAIAAQFGIEVIDFKWDGKFPKKRNWYLRTHTPTTKWVLFLDADEYITPAFKNELREALKTDDFVGYWLNYTIYFMGKINRGGYPLKKLALFKVGAGEYERIDEEQWSKLDMEIHEHPILNGTLGLIKSKIDHRDFRGINHYVAKHSEYASWEASRYLKISQDDTIRNSWTWKQKLKYRLMRSVLIGPVYFLGSFFLLGGFRDGKRGLAFAILKMSYFNQIYCKIKENEA